MDTYEWEINISFNKLPYLEALNFKHKYIQ